MYLHTCSATNTQIVGVVLVALSNFMFTIVLRLPPKIVLDECVANNIVSTSNPPRNIEACSSSLIQMLILTKSIVGGKKARM